MATTPFLDLLQPFFGLWFIAVLIELLFHSRQYYLRITYDRNLRNTVFANLGRININMNNFCLWSKIRQLARYTIREARPNRHQ